MPISAMTVIPIPIAEGISIPMVKNSISNRYYAISHWMVA
ncbi:Uncharacterised protein [Vibrio cholerae]|nr:Uncharacterised protein [Vibrio cholerae]